MPDLRKSQATANLHLLDKYRKTVPKEMPLRARCFLKSEKERTTERKCCCWQRNLQ